MLEGGGLKFFTHAHINTQNAIPWLAKGKRGKEGERGKGDGRASTEVSMGLFGDCLREKW